MAVSPTVHFIKSWTSRPNLYNGNIVILQGEKSWSKVMVNGRPSRPISAWDLCDAQSSWCASNWDALPPDSLRQTPIVGADGLRTNVQLCNLNFDKSGYKNCWDLYANYPTPSKAPPELIEGAASEGSGVKFVPFKSPNPDGYQGVWGCFSNLSQLELQWSHNKLKNSGVFQLIVADDYNEPRRLSLLSWRLSQ